MNNENIINNENVEAVAEAVKSSAGDKAAAVVIFGFATYGAYVVIDKGVKFAKNKIKNHKAKKAGKDVETAVTDIADAIEGKFEEVKETLKK